MLRRIAISLMLAFLGTAPATAQDYQKGLAAAKRGDYTTTLREWRPLAEQGNAKAQYSLAQLYRQGEGVRRDYVEAMKWYSKAAEQGYAKAQYSLGAMHAIGLGIPKDYAQAARWYHAAAEQGHAAAQVMLGGFYDVGRGVPQDYVLAHMWFSLSGALKNERNAKSGDDLIKKMTPAQIAEAEKLAREWRAKHKKK